jgi:hypothetical protein
MPMACSICTHPERQAIDRAVFAREPNRRIAAHFDVTEQAVRRHKSDHLPAKLAKAAEMRETDEAVDLLREMHALRRKAMDLLAKAERAGQIRVALQGIREARACLELLAEMEGDLDRRATVNLVLLPEWVAVRTVLLDALRPHPEARIHVTAALVALEAGDDQS